MINIAQSLFLAVFRLLSQERRSFSTDILRIHSCTITGSSDSSIKDVVPNDLSAILDNSRVTRIFANGTTSYNLYQKYIYPVTNIPAVKLPSTSPANAAFSLERLKQSWNIITE